MKKIIFIMLLFVLAVFACCSKGNDEVAVTVRTITVTNITLNKTTLSLTEGSDQTLIATITPENSTNNNITWTSNNTDIATVDTDGKVTAVKEGSANISVTTEDSNKTATCAVTVKPSVIEIEIATAGNLSSLIPDNEKLLIENLTLTGELNSMDVRTINTLTNLKHLDMSGIKIVASDVLYYGGVHTIDNIFPSYFIYNINILNNLKSIICPNSVKKIGDNAFGALYIATVSYRYNSLASITIPNGVTSIGDYAFSGCKTLVSITIPDGVTSIGSDAFNGCSSLTSITIPNSVTNTEWSVFGRCSALTSTTIPNSVTSIGDYAFGGCIALTSIIIPDGVTIIGRGAFESCTALTSIAIPNNVTNIGYCTSHKYPSGGWAFYNCTALTSITIPDNVTSIEEGTFNNCTALTSVTIPNSVTRIGEYAFSGCSNLKEIHLKIKTPIYYSNFFFNCDYFVCKLYVPKESVDLYLKTPGWSNFQNIIGE